MNNAYRFSKTIFSEDKSSSSTLGLILAAIMLLTKVTGLVYQILINNLLGTGSSDRNIFYTALIIPDLLCNILLLGAVSSAVIPIMNRVRASQGEQKYYETFVLGIQTFFGIHFIFALLCVIFTPQIIHLLLDITNNKSLSSEDINSVIFFTRVMVFPQVILSISSYISAALQTLNRFIIPYLASLAYNVVQILGLLLLYPYFGENLIWPLIIGTIGAYVIHLSVQIPLLKTTGFWGILKTNLLKLKELYTNRGLVWVFIAQSFPRMLALSADLGLMKILFLFAGSLSISEVISTASGARFNTTLSLIAVPFSLFVLPTVQIIFPKLSKLFADNNLDEFADHLSKNTQKVLFYVVPVTAITIVLSLSVVRLTFGIFPARMSKLTWEDTNVIAIILSLFALSLIWESMITFFQRAFFAAHKSVYPLVFNIIYITLTIGFAKLFTNLLSHAHGYDLMSVDYMKLSNYLTPSNTINSEIAVAGIAIAISLSNLVTFAIYYIFMPRILNLELGNFIGHLSKKLLSGTFMATVMFTLTVFWKSNISQTQTIWGLLIFSIIIASVGLLSYLLAASMLKVEESYYFKDKLKKLLFNA